MRNIKIFKLLLISILALAMGSCDKDVDPISTISSFEDYTVSMASGPVALEECGTVVTLNFSLDEKQITDLAFEVHVGESSTATEGEDFDLITHDVAISTLR